MKKAIISAILAAVLLALPVFACFAFAEELQQSTKLSPAFDVIAARQGMVKSGLVRENLQFTETDFKQCIGVSELDYIKITQVPNSTDGILVVGSMTVTDGQKIDASLLSMLNFVPASDEIETASFSFCGDESTSASEIKCNLRLGERVNYAPTIASVDNSPVIETQKGKLVSAEMSALDPEGDKLIYEIISYPSNGTVSITDIQTGAFTYTPYSNFTGRDSFEYVARDDWGNYTTPSTVYIAVK